MLHCDQANHGGRYTHDSEQALRPMTGRAIDEVMKRACPFLYHLLIISACERTRQATCAPGLHERRHPVRSMHHREYAMITAARLSTQRATSRTTDAVPERASSRSPEIPQHHKLETQIKFVRPSQIAAQVPSPKEGERVGSEPQLREKPACNFDSSGAQLTLICLTNPRESGS